MDESAVTSNFAFLSSWSACEEIQLRAQNAERAIKNDPRVSAFYARNCLELLVETIFDIDNWLSRPRHDKTLMSLIHERGFKDNLKHGLFGKFKLIIQIGNAAVHGKNSPPQRDALQSVKELHHILYWFVWTYSPKVDRKSFDVEAFNEALIPETLTLDRKLVLGSAAKLQDLEKKIAAKDKATRDADEKALKENKALREENARLLAEVAKAKEQAKSASDQHDYKEAETRTYLIDPLLKEAGWLLDQERDREYPVSGMPLSFANPKGNGFVDYVLWGDDDTALAVVEAKASMIGPEEGKTQAKLYADCLEQQCGVRPIVFYTNGYETRLWDDSFYPPRDVQGFYTKDELKLMIKRREVRCQFFSDDREHDAESIAAKIDDDISDRHYQKAAITHILEDFDKERRRKALLVMATGTGKTRTIISLVDLLTQHDWVKNVLFLADRNALLAQAKKSFVKLVPRISCSILSSGVTKDNLDSRLYFSTYPTMKNLLDRESDERPFGIGHFDLVIVDEAHRSVYKKYRQIFEYFDGLLVGLTATPKSEVEKNTYSIFDLQSGLPTYAYEDQSAYDEGYLVPPRKMSASTHFIREGIKYEELSEEDQEQWEEKEELVERNEVLPTELNTFLFNENTAEKMFAQLFTQGDLGGIHVGGGDVIGKTIIFAANNEHAKFLQTIFDKNFPKWAGKLAQVITYKNRYAQSLIDEFSDDKKAFDPNNASLRVAISVDMLDTGIDVPEVVNLVFLKVVRSKVKFLQMLGRGTRLCPDLFAPGDDKAGFKVFDYCQNFEYFGQNPEGASDSGAKPLGQQVFEKRVKLSSLISACSVGEERPDYKELLDLQRYQMDLLHHQVSGMNLDNFMVRPKRESVEPFLKREHWDEISDSKYTALESDLSALPSEAESFNADEENKEINNRFDNLILTMQLSLLEKGKIPEQARQRVMEFAQRLVGKTNVPAILENVGLLEEVQRTEFWVDIECSTLEKVRRVLRNLLFALDKIDKEVVYTNFDDHSLTVEDVTDQFQTSSVDLKLYRSKNELYIREHDDHLTIQKLKRNKPITQGDLDVLEELLIKASGMADSVSYREKILENKPLGSFIRELVGLDKSAAKAAFSDFLDEGIYNSQQIEFVNQLVDYLTDNGVLEAERVFEPPFTDAHDDSVYGFFEEDKVIELLGRIEQIQANAEAGEIEEASSA